MFQRVRNSEGWLIKVSVLQESNSELNISFDQLEHLEDEQHCPWVSAPSYMVPSATTPYGSTYNPSWGNHTNSSWEPRPPQYAPPASPYYASTPQPPQPP